jgi:hypothetical protein
MRISDMPLLTPENEGAGKRTAPADLHHVAERGEIRGLADDTVIELLAALACPAQ